ncbi:hypothetical protein BDW72DRAFT_21311 [Aspergillus terricola var. indicus]
MPSTFGSCVCCRVSFMHDNHEIAAVRLATRARRFFYRFYRDTCLCDGLVLCCPTMTCIRPKEPGVTALLATKAYGQIRVDEEEEFSPLSVHRFVHSFLSPAKLYFCSCLGPSAASLACSCCLNKEPCLDSRIAMDGLSHDGR